MRKVQTLKRLLPFILVLGFIIPIQPANSAVSCSSIKLNIQKIEKKILAELLYFQSLPKDEAGGIYVQKFEADGQRMEAFSQKPWFYDVWKLGTNNPKCFTNTQKIALKDPNFKKAITYLRLVIGSTIGETHPIFDNKYKSIYKY